MKGSRLLYVVSGSALVMVLVAFLWSCETMQPVLDTAAELGVSAGAITVQQADSLKRSTRAVGKTFQDITPEQEYYIGRSVAATILTHYRPFNNAEANRYINLVGQTLAQASDRPETFGGYHFLILDSSEANAFAAPGGLILVTRGMLKLCKNEDEIAAVLAHEIGHVQGQHGLRAIKRDRLTSALTILAGEGLKTFGSQELAQLTEAFEGSVADVSRTLMNSGYSRELEGQADVAAVTILKRVGYEPSALENVLAEMNRQIKPGSAGLAKTHPNPSARIQSIAYLSKEAPEMAAPARRKLRFVRVMLLI